MAQVKYTDILEAAWAEHLAPRAENAPTVISTFAGAGGSSLGYSMAGYRELLAVEWDNNAVETFRLNFPDVPVYHGDICKLTVEECMRLAGLSEPGQLDVLDGSPPCQGFSTAGKRDMADDRNQLFREFVRLLRGLKPKVFVMENVSGMVKGKMKLIFADIMRELKASGYVVSARLLNAMYFNVPQSRERMIFIGVREDLGQAPSHPKAESRPIVLRDALTGYDESRVEKPLPSDLLRYVPHHAGGWNTDVQIYQKLNGRSGGTMNAKWCDWKRVCGTIPKMETSIAGHIHPNKKRFLNVCELQRLGSFPDTYTLPGKREDCVMRIGNSVPPLFMRSIARHIRSEILSKTPTLVQDA